MNEEKCRHVHDNERKGHPFIFDSLRITSGAQKSAAYQALDALTTLVRQIRKNTSCLPKSGLLPQHKHTELLTLRYEF